MRNQSFKIKQNLWKEKLNALYTLQTCEKTLLTTAKIGVNCRMGICASVGVGEVTKGACECEVFARCVHVCACMKCVTRNGVNYRQILFVCHWWARWKAAMARKPTTGVFVALIRFLSPSIGNHGSLLILRVSTFCRCVQPVYSSQPASCDWLQQTAHLGAWSADVWDCHGNNAICR